MNDYDRLKWKLSGIEPWQDSADGAEYRGPDGYSLYDLSLADSMPCEQQVAVVVTAWSGQLKWLAATLASYRRSGAYVVLAYDHHTPPWMVTSTDHLLRTFPNPRHYQLASAVVFKHTTYDCNKRAGWFWDIRYAQGVLRNFPNLKHIYVTNGDCAWDRPDGLPQLIDLLGTGDLLPGQQWHETFHTASVLYKADAFHRIVDHMADQMRVPIMGSLSAERLLQEAVKALSLRVVPAPLQPRDPTDGSVDMYARYGQQSTFREVVGFRNLFAEYETAGNEGRDVAFLKPYVDLNPFYWGGEERETVCQYWATGDRRYLYQWQDRWEDSDYNRLSYPLTHYGSEPIFA